jgi:queuine tRNA-ribosyltransferase
MFEFTIIAKQARARAGIFHTPHGDLVTPVFAPSARECVIIPGRSFARAQLESLYARRFRIRL